MTAAGIASPATTAARPQICVFTKPLGDVPWKDLGPAIRKTGAQAVELTVRPGGHVLPERVREDLPAAVEALAAHGVSVPAITSAITSASHASTRPLLETAARLKIPQYRLGYWLYRDAAPPETLARVRQEVRALVAMGKDLGIVAGWHNHPGDYVGRSLWDIWAIIEDLDPAWIGYHYDVSHGTSDGGAAEWKVQLRLALPRLKMVVAKDHIFDKTARGWARRNCALGSGRTDYSGAFAMLAQAGYAGPVSVAVEYEFTDAVAAIAGDVAFIRHQIAAAYGS